MSKNNLNIGISDPAWEELISDIEERSQKIFDSVMKKINLEVLAEKDVSANLLLSDDSEVHKLNLEFREIDKPTNILSFANIDDEDFEEYIKRTDDVELGDMILARETMIKESEELGISLIDHYTHLLVHGILHLLGYDHILSEDATQMENLEIELLKSFNITNPYEEEK